MEARLGEPLRHLQRQFHIEDRAIAPIGGDAHLDHVVGLHQGRRQHLHQPIGMLLLQAQQTPPKPGAAGVIPQPHRQHRGCLDRSEQAGAGGQGLLQEREEGTDAGHQNQHTDHPQQGGLLGLAEPERWEGRVV